MGQVGLDKGSVGQGTEWVAAEIEYHNTGWNVGRDGRQVAATAVGGLKTVAPGTSACGWA